MKPEVVTLKHPVEELNGGVVDFDLLLNGVSTGGIGKLLVTEVPNGATVAISVDTALRFPPGKEIFTIWLNQSQVDHIEARWTPHAVWRIVQPK